MREQERFREEHIEEQREDRVAHPAADGGAEGAGLSEQPVAEGESLRVDRDAAMVRRRSRGRSHAGGENGPIRAGRSTSFGIFVVCLVFGFLLSVQFKSVELSVEAERNSLAMQAAEMQALLNREREKTQGLYEELLRYKDDVAGYREQALQSGDYAAVVARELERAELIAGLTDVEGPGVTVTVSDAPREIPQDPTADANLYLVHDDDLLKVVNELRDAGAEAVSVNGERLVATSEIRCAGSIVSVNNNRYAAPYVVQAIGDSRALASALTMRGGMVDQLTYWGIGIVVEQQESLVIGAYTGKTAFAHAQEYQGEREET